MWSGGHMTGYNTSQDTCFGSEDQNRTTFDPNSLGVSTTPPTPLRRHLAPSVTQDYLISSLDSELFPQPWRVRRLHRVHAIRDRHPPMTSEDETSNSRSLKSYEERLRLSEQSIALDEIPARHLFNCEFNCSHGRGHLQKYTHIPWQIKIFRQTSYHITRAWQAFENGTNLYLVFCHYSCYHIFRIVSNYVILYYRVVIGYPMGDIVVGKPVWSIASCLMSLC